MALKYRYDPDLEFFQHLTSEDFNDLVQTLIKDEKNNSRLTEELTSENEYKRYSPDHKQYWELIAAEIQHFGANSLASLFRGTGVLYKEVLADVCDHMKVNFNKNSSAERIEQQLLSKILEDAIEKMSPAEIKELAETVGIKNPQSITKQALTGSFITIFKLGGFKSYQLTLIIVNVIIKAILGRGLSIAANSALTRVTAVLMALLAGQLQGLGPHLILRDLLIESLSLR